MGFQNRHISGENDLLQGRWREGIGSLLPQAEQCRSDRLMDRQWLQAVALDMQQDVGFLKAELVRKGIVLHFREVFVMEGG